MTTPTLHFPMPNTLIDNDRLVVASCYYREWEERPTPATRRSLRRSAQREHIDPGDTELLQWAGVPEEDA